MALLSQGMVIKDGAKMSKSKGNVVSDDFVRDKYGADTGRLFELFAAPPEKDLEWNDQGIEGASRFLNRVWRFVMAHLSELGGGGTPPPRAPPGPGRAAPPPTPTAPPGRPGAAPAPTARPPASQHRRAVPPAPPHSIHRR